MSHEQRIGVTRHGYKVMLKKLKVVGEKSPGPLKASDGLKEEIDGALERAGNN